MWADDTNYNRKGPAPDWNYLRMDDPDIKHLIMNQLAIESSLGKLSPPGFSSMPSTWYFKGGDHVPLEFRNWRYNPDKLLGWYTHWFYRWNGTKMEAIEVAPVGEYEITLVQLRQIIELDKRHEYLMKLQMANEQEPIRQRPVTLSEAYPWTPPEKWYFRGDREMGSMVPELKKWKSNTQGLQGDAHRCLYVYDGTIFYQVSSLPEENYQEITVDQLRQIINMKETSNKKIVGYRVIKALPDVDKGSVCTNDGDFWSFPANGRSDWATRRYSQKTVGQATDYFEPIYEEIAITIGKYKAELNGSMIQFGCQNFTKEQLGAYHNLLTRDFKVKLSIEGVDITADMVAKVLKMLPASTGRGIIEAKDDNITYTENKVR